MTDLTELAIEHEQEKSELVEKIEKLTKQLEIAKEVLKEYANEDHWCDCYAAFHGFQADNACYGINGFSEAQEALWKIKELEK